jgi:hypothetical protein
LLDKRARYSESRHCLVFEGSGVQSNGNNLLKFISLARHYSLLDQQAAHALVAHLGEGDLSSGHLMHYSGHQDGEIVSFTATTNRPSVNGFVRNGRPSAG